MKLIKLVKCFFGIHQWPIWQTGISLDKTYYYRFCEVCVCYEEMELVTGSQPAEGVKK